MKKIIVVIILIVACGWSERLCAETLVNQKIHTNYWDEGIQKHRAGVSLTGAVRLKKYETIDEAFERVSKKTIWRLVLYCIDKKFEIPATAVSGTECLTYILRRLNIQRHADRFDESGNRIAMVTVQLQWDKEVKKTDEKAQADYFEKLQKIFALKHITDESFLEHIPKVGPGKHGPPSGLIIDARGTGLKPHLSFIMKGDHSRAQYTPNKLEADNPVRKNSLRWTNSMDEALEDSRLGHRRITVKVSKIKKSEPVCIWIDDRNLNQYLKIKLAKLLEENRVVVVF